MATTMPLDVNLLEASFKTIVLPIGNEFESRFYQRLFERCPRLKSRLEPLVTQRARLLIGALEQALLSFEDPASFAAIIPSDSEIETTYGVGAEDYALVAENLIDVLDEVGGNRWTSRHMRVWRDACHVVLQAFHERDILSSPVLVTDRGHSDSRPGVTAQVRDESAEPESDLFALVSEYLDLNHRLHGAGPPLLVAELARWRDIRRSLENALGSIPLPGSSNRRYLRVPTRLNVTVISRSRSVSGLMTEIGEGGAFIGVNDPPAPRTKLAIEIVIEPEGQVLAVDGVVVWVRQAPHETNPPGMGIRFTHLSQDQRDGIDYVIKTCLLQALD